MITIKPIIAMIIIPMPVTFTIVVNSSLEGFFEIMKILLEEDKKSLNFPGRLSLEKKFPCPSEFSITKPKIFF